MGTEVELKLVTSRSALRKAMALPWLRKMTGDTVKHQHLTSVYFDTPKLALRDHGVSLRVRRVGDQRLQTIKSTSGALVARDEWEQTIEGDQPKLELAGKTALAPLLNGKIKDQLQPVFETDVERVTMLLRVGSSEMELAFDAGRINTAGDHADISEIEVELTHGERHDAAISRDVSHEAFRSLSNRTPKRNGATPFSKALCADRYSPDRPPFRPPRRQRMHSSPSDSNACGILRRTRLPSAGPIRRVSIRCASD